MSEQRSTDQRLWALIAAFALAALAGCNEDKAFCKYDERHHAAFLRCTADPRCVTTVHDVYVEQTYLRDCGRSDAK